MTSIDRRKIFSNPVNFLAFGFGAGLAPKAPGTVGTLVAVPLLLLCESLSLPIFLLLILLMSVIGIWLCHQCSNNLKVHDHPGIVWDEIVGYFITMIGVSFTWQNLLLGFILFRFFDIVKPWPIKAIDRHVEGGLGIMLDDILAGAFAWAILFTLNMMAWFPI